VTKVKIYGLGFIGRAMMNSFCVREFDTPVTFESWGFSV